MTSNYLRLANQYSTFSGADIVCSITVPAVTNDVANGGKIITLSPVTIGSLDTISISTHRDSVPVRAFKSVNPRGFTRGTRTIAGSLIFKMFDQESLWQVQRLVSAFYQQASNQYSQYFSNAQIATLIPYLGVDDLPPFDITITMANESGQAAYEKILGVQIITNGHVAGINDLYMEEQMSYCALGYQPLSAGFSTTSGPYQMQ